MQFRFANSNYQVFCRIIDMSLISEAKNWQMPQSWYSMQEVFKSWYELSTWSKDLIDEQGDRYNLKKFSN